MNMSYCRFTNTSTDVGDCLDAIRRDDKISDFEAVAGRQMFRKFLNFCREYEIIDGYDNEMIEELFNELQRE